MGTPFHHALSSAKRFGGIWQDYIALHQWFDASKALLADVRHRALRHHSEGIFATEAPFGTVLVRMSDGGTVPTRLVGEQHVFEDFGRIPPALEWLRLLPMQPWMRPEVVVDVHASAAAAATEFGGSARDFLGLIGWFEAPAAQLANARARLLRHHAAGIVEVAATLGEHLCRADGRAVATRAVAAWHIRTVLGTVPAPADWLCELPLQSWMARGARAMTAELERLARAYAASNNSHVEIDETLQGVAHAVSKA